MCGPGKKYEGKVTYLRLEVRREGIYGKCDSDDDDEACDFFHFMQNGCTFCWVKSQQNVVYGEKWNKD